MAIQAEQQLLSALRFFRKELTEAILQNGLQQVIPPHTPLVSVGQHVRYIPLVISGIIKVTTHYEEKELLLYYIKPSESCIMSFSAGVAKEPSQINAITEEESSLLLLPADKINEWIGLYPELNRLFLNQYHKRYGDLIHTIQHLIYDTLDQRLLHHLKERAAIRNENTLKVSHRELANELGTAREVVTRLLKKLERENRIQLTTDHRIILL
jgi:CRP/FNR family transcriptional regulator